MKCDGMKCGWIPEVAVLSLAFLTSQEVGAVCLKQKMTNPWRFIEEKSKGGGECEVKGK